MIAPLSSEWRDDADCEPRLIDRVESAGDGWSVTFDDGWSLWITSKLCGVAPKPGETALIFGPGIGRPVRGVVIAERVYRYATADEWAAQERQARRDEAMERAERERVERPERDAKIARLSAPLQARIRRFAATRDDWAAEHEPYEIFCCEEADRIATALGNGDAIKAFYSASSEEQRGMVPGLRYEEHSGNTFGVSCRLAWHLVEGQDALTREHGALCPLVGCERYGCWAAYEGRGGAA